MIKRFVLVFSFLITTCLSAHSQAVEYNAIATAYVTTTISQNVVFDSNMQAGGTFTFSVLAHNGGGRANQADTANVKIQFYNSSNVLISTVNSSYSANLPIPTGQDPPRADPAVPWTVLTTSSTDCGGSCANVAYAKVSMYGIDASFWAGDYGPWYRAPTLQLNGGNNLLYNPEFGPAYGYNAQGWTTNPGMGACQGAWGGSNPCIVNSAGVPGTSTVGLVANANGGGPVATGGTTSGTAGGYSNTMTVTNAGAGTGLAAPTAPVVTVTGTAVTYTTSSVITSPGVTSTYRTPVTTKTWSDGTTTTENGTPVLTNTAVASTVTTTKVNGSTLTTYNTPILTNTPADGSAPFISANGQQTSTSQQVQQGLNYKVYDFDAYTYTCTIFGCAKNLLGPYSTPNLTPGAYTANHTGKTTNGVYVPTNGSFPNMGDGTLVAYNGTFTAPITTTRPAGTIYRIYFYSNNDDGFVMKLNGHTVINDQSTFQLQALGNGYTSNGWMDLVAGQTYNFEAWYWNDTGGYGLNLKWDIGGGRVGIPNSAFTTGTLDNVVIDTTGLAYTNDAIVPVAGLCCGGSAVPFDASTSNTAKVMNFVNRTTADSQVYIEQVGTQNKVLVEQSGTRNNYVNYYGNGLSNDVEIIQQGNASTQVNYVDLSVIGNFNTVKIEQTSTGGAKGAFVNVQDNNNSLILKQQGSGSHYAEVNLSGGNKTVDVLQEGAGNHMASVTLTGPQPSSLNLIQSGATQQYYSITNNCSTVGGCAPISVTQGR